MAPPMKQKTLQKEGGPGISLNPTCTQGDSLLLSVSTIVSEECPLTKECPPPTVHAQLHNFHLAITECVFVSSHFEVPSLMIQISMALTLKYSLSWLHLSQCLRDLGINPNIPNTSDIATLNLINDIQLNLRQAFFEELASKGLGNEGDVLVSHCSSGSK